MAWAKVIESKKNGGLGVGSIKALRIALIVKCWWRLKTEPNNLWASVIYMVFIICITS